jgi:hypothetical protein
MPRSTFPEIGIPTLPTHTSKSQTLQRLRLSAPELAATIALLLDRWDPEVGYCCADDHAGAKNKENDAVLAG